MKAADYTFDPAAPEPGQGGLAGGGAARRAFTLIELMVVVGLMGLVMTMSVPMVYKLWHKAPMIKAVRDVTDVLAHVRAQAIMQNAPAEIIFHPKDRSMEVSGAVRSAPPATSPQGQLAQLTRPGASQNDDLGLTAAAQAPPPRSGLSATLDPSIIIEMLDINLNECKDADVAKARFFPDGTCDELTIILHSDKGEWYKISLEITTSLATAGPVDR